MAHDEDPGDGGSAAEIPADLSALDADRLPSLAGARVGLRSLAEADLDDLFAIFSHPEVMRYWSSTPLVDRGGAKRLLDEIHDPLKHRRLFQWGIARRPDDRVIGTCTLFQLDATHRRCELGYALGREHWGQGYMNEALVTLLDFAFATLRLHRVEADVDPRNAPSIRTLERLGFRREGYLRERWHVAGEIQDALFFGLLRPEWNAAGAAIQRR